MVSWLKEQGEKNKMGLFKKKKLIRNGTDELVGLLAEEVTNMQLTIDKLSLENREMDIRLKKLGKKK